MSATAGIQTPACLTQGALKAMTCDMAMFAWYVGMLLATGKLMTTMRTPSALSALHED